MPTPSETIYNALPKNCPEKIFVDFSELQAFHIYIPYLETTQKVVCLGIERNPVCVKCPLRKPSYTVLVQGGLARIEAENVKFNP